MAQKTQGERRLYLRIALSTAARLLVDNGEEHACEIVDLSLTGAALRLPYPLAPATRCMVSFDVDFQEKPRRINALGAVVYMRILKDDKHLVGIKFIDMDGYSKFLLKELTDG